MKRLLLNSYNIKPVNIRIVSNGVECADLKMLKENFCISDIKNVLDGRLVNWLSNIGEKELADSINEKYSSPDSLNGKEYYLCELFFKNFTQKDYIQVLFKEKSANLFTKEISRLPNLLLEAYNYYPDRFSLEQWNNFLSVSLGTSEELKRLKAILEQKQLDDEKNNKMSKNAGDIMQIDYLSKFLRLVLNSLAQQPAFGDIAKIRAESILNGYKGYLNPEYQILAEDFIASFENFYFYDRPKIRGAITGFIKRYNLTAIKL